MIYGIFKGIISGYIASRLQKGKGSGCLVNLILGLIGGVVSGWVFTLFGLTTYTWIEKLVMSVIGAVIVLWLFSLLK